MTDLKLKKWDPVCYQLLRVDEQVGFLLQTGTDLWAVFDRRDCRVSDRAFGSPRKAFNHAKTLPPAKFN